MLAVGEEEKRLTAGQAARVCGVNRDTVRAWIEHVYGHRGGPCAPAADLRRDGAARRGRWHAPARRDGARPVPARRRAGWGERPPVLAGPLWSEGDEPVPWDVRSWATMTQPTTFPGGGYRLTASGRG